jgi:radical SAM superfamily enzyme YgiQ (UPF0313 family)
MMPNNNFLLISNPSWCVDFPNYTLGYVKSIILSAGWNCDVIDFNQLLYDNAENIDKSRWTDPCLWEFEPLKINNLYDKYENEIKNKLKVLSEKKYDIIGFSVTLESRYFSQNVIKLIKSYGIEDTVILMGGPDCFPNEHGKNYLYCENRPDIILQGEAEIALPKFLKEYSNTHDYRTKINGFVYYQNNNIVDTGFPEKPNLKENVFIADPSFFYSQLPKNGSFIFSTFLTKGCVNKCAFCNEHLNYSPFRFRSSNDVFKEIKDIIENIPFETNSVFVLFNDSLFNSYQKGMEELLDLIIDSKIRINWRASTSFSKKISNEQFKKMKSSGCNSLFWGFETASQLLLDLMGKNYKIADAIEMINNAKKYEINSDLGVITGFPGETTKEFIHTLDFIIMFGPQPNITFAFVQPLIIKKNTDLYNNPSYYGIADTSESDWTTIDGNNTLQLRLLRKFILESSIKIIKKDQIDKSFIFEVDFNSYAVAKEIINIVENIGMRLGNKTYYINKFTNIPQKIIPNKILDERIKGVPEYILAKKYGQWFLKDKNDRFIIHKMIKINHEKNLIIDNLLILLTEYINSFQNKKQIEMLTPLEFDYSNLGETHSNVELINDLSFNNGTNIIVNYRDKFLRISGWVVDLMNKCSANTIYIQIDNQIYPCFYGIERKDVALHFKNNNYLYSGFYANIPLKKIRMGEKNLKLFIISADESGYYEVAYNFKLSSELQLGVPSQRLTN